MVSSNLMPTRISDEGLKSAHKLGRDQSHALSCRHANRRRTTDNLLQDVYKTLMDFEAVFALLVAHC